MAVIGPLGKLDRLCSKKKSFQLTNNRLLTSFSGRLILSLSLLILSMSTPRVHIRHIEKVQLSTLCNFLLKILEEELFYKRQLDR